MHVSQKIASAFMAGCLAVGMSPSFAFANEADVRENDSLEVSDAQVGLLASDSACDDAVSEDEVHQPQEIESDPTQTDEADDSLASEAEVGTEEDLAAYSDVDVTDNVEGDAESEAPVVSDDGFVDGAIGESEEGASENDSAASSEDDDMIAMSNYDVVVATLPDDEGRLDDNLNNQAVQKTGTIEITYVCHDTGKRLAGAIFEAIDVQTGESLGVGVTDENGRLVFTGIPFGKEVQINAIKSPDGYDTVRHEDITTVVFDKNGEWFDTYKPNQYPSGGEYETTQDEPFEVSDNDIWNNHDAFEFYFGARAVDHPESTLAQLGQKLTWWLDIYEDDTLENFIESIYMDRLQSYFENSGIRYYGPTSTHDVYRFAATKPCFIVGNLVCLNRDQGPSGYHALNYELQLEHAHDGIFHLRYAGLTNQEVDDFHDHHPEDVIDIPDHSDGPSGDSDVRDDGENGADTPVADDSPNGDENSSDDENAAAEGEDGSSAYADATEQAEAIEVAAGEAQNPVHCEAESPETGDEGATQVLFASAIAAVSAIGVLGAYRRKRRG